MQMTTADPEPKHPELSPSELDGGNHEGLVDAAMHEEGDDNGQKAQDQANDNQ